MKNLYFIAGEASGDLIGQLLIKEFSNYSPIGVGGPLMQKEGLQEIGVYQDLQVMGITDVLFNLPTLLKRMKEIQNHILEVNPPAVIFIDAPDLTLNIAKKLRKKGYLGKLILYVSPTVWAWKKGRIKTMEKSLDLLLTLFPFEPPYYAHTKLPTHFVGHPLQEILPQPSSLKDQPLLALFPGSRKGEIKKTFPLLIEATKQFLKTHPDFKVALSISAEKHLPLLQSIAKPLENIQWVRKEDNHLLMDQAQISLATSGTITLELAWFQTPTCVFYGLTSLERMIAPLLGLNKIPYFCIVNKIENREVFPELIKKGFEPKNVVQVMETLLNQKSSINAWSQLQQETTPSKKAFERIKELL
ncbi:lipid-A-disaccharide synthase [Chlamydiales bacterium]|nr:lipid-A-disaccharide synthase [Chlamydiales bacterium]